MQNYSFLNLNLLKKKIICLIDGRVAQSDKVDRA